MKVIEAPNPLADIEGQSLFLAGSIEMGWAVQWQQRVIAELNDLPITILNPRRNDWDSSWKQDMSDLRFVEQVNWELNALQMADAILFYFDPNTKSPITLLELGFCAHYVKPVFVCCPEGFWRKGNVDIVCNRYAMVQEDDLSSLIASVRHSLFANSVQP